MHRLRILEKKRERDIDSGVITDTATASSMDLGLVTVPTMTAVFYCLMPELSCWKGWALHMNIIMTNEEYIISWWGRGGWEGECLPPLLALQACCQVTDYIFCSLKCRKYARGCKEAQSAIGKSITVLTSSPSISQESFQSASNVGWHKIFSQSWLRWCTVTFPLSFVKISIWVQDSHNTLKERWEQCHF